MSLYEDIKKTAGSLAAATSETPDWLACAAALMTPAIVVIDSRPWIYATIADATSEDVSTAVRRLLQSLTAVNPDLADAHNLLLLGDGMKTGLRLDKHDRQVKLDELAAMIPDEAKPLIAVIKSLGRRTVPVNADATAQTCQAAWEAGVIADAAIALHQSITARRAKFDRTYQQIRQQIESGEITADGGVTAAIAVEFGA